MNDIHGLKQAQEALRASEAELRLIMDNVPARVAVHRPRLPLPLPQPPQRGMAGREPQGADRPARSPRSSATSAPRSCSRCSTACWRARRSRPRSCWRSPTASERWESIHYAPQPRRRGQRDRHLRGAHRHPRPEAQRGRAAARQLDAVVAHQQHAARGAGVGPRLPAGALVAAGREHLRLERRRGARHAARRQPAACTRTTARRSPAWWRR